MGHGGQVSCGFQLRQLKYFLSAISTMNKQQPLE